MLKFSTLAVASLALSLAACGGKADNSSAPTVGGSVAAVPAPAGTAWADSVVKTAEGGYLMGNPKAAIKLTEFGSLTCSHCRDFQVESAEPLRALVNTGKISYEFRNYVRDPLDISMALLTRCGDPETFFPLTDQFFGNQAAMFEKAQGMGDAAYQAAMNLPPQQRFISLAQTTGLLDFAKQRGVAEEPAKQCLANTKEVEALAKGVQDATAQYNIQGTPAFLINGTMVENVTTWDALRAKLRDAGAS